MSDQPQSHRRHQPEDEREHQRDAGAALLLGAVVVALLMFGYVYLHG